MKPNAPLLIAHVKAARAGIENRFKELSRPACERDLIIGVMSGLSGQIDGVRRLKIDSSKRYVLTSITPAVTCLISS